GVCLRTKSLPHGSADRNIGLAPEWVAKLVAPSRERGSKPHQERVQGARRHVAPSRERGSKRLLVVITGRGACRSLTGARIETSSGWRTSGRAGVAPSRERGSKPVQPGRAGQGRVSLPHGSADRNLKQEYEAFATAMSLPHGSADRNFGG